MGRYDGEDYEPGWAAHIEPIRKKQRECLHRNLRRYGSGWGGWSAVCTSCDSYVGTVAGDDPRLINPLREVPHGA